MVAEQNQVDPVGTYACKVGGSVRMQLRLPVQHELSEPMLRLQHRRTNKIIEMTPAVQPSGDGQLLTVEAPEAGLDHGLWWVALRPDPESEYRRIEARLLLNDRQPLALLAGPMPETKMSPPAPRADRRTPGRVHQKAAATANRVLRHLPEERASRYRASLARVARRVRL
jgi:hypothetical protein